VQVVVKELVSQDGKRKVEIFRRGDGTCGFQTLKFSDDPLEMSWIQTGRYSECVAPDEVAAETEARSRVEWLTEQTDG
jgi:hypothetical protein